MSSRLDGYVAGNAPKFKAYMAKVDAVVMKKYGLSAMDLVDIDYFSLFEDGVSASAAAKLAIAESGG